MKRLRECIEEVTKFSLQSHINKSLNFELQLSPEFCSNLLLDSDLIDPNPDISKGVPSYPLYKHLALALNQSIVSGFICSRQGNSALMRDEISSEQKEKWNKLVSTKGLELINIMNTIDFELHVQEPFFSMSRDGFKTIEGWCAVGKYNNIEPGSMILLNKCLVLEVQDVRHYATFSKMLEAESISQVLPGVKSTEEAGLQTYRKFYTEEEERSYGVIAICVSNLVVQPAILLASILSELSYEGVQSLLGLAHTTGTISDVLSPPKSTLLSSFMLSYNPDVKGSTLTHGARALAKHVNRSSNKYWGNLNGSDSNKNKLAMGVIMDLISNSCWLNMYTVQPHGDVFEIRVAEGYGARWSKDGYKFIGFLEPYMDDGHLKGWKH
ncbi:hypothetical protein ES332_D02G141600v1 [Gossypium tomentosum]|uniref:ASCH domain-containing protein n=1 Tax=Gossypium tomentosum TaxID=34277 RepID=A0A5D2LWZ2_GOSTO|nr:hypothetical protein ES332_D02G141600v1 [Gossypium tomentosum]